MTELTIDPFDLDFDALSTVELVRKAQIEVQRALAETHADLAEERLNDRPNFTMVNKLKLEIAELKIGLSDLSALYLKRAEEKREHDRRAAAEFRKLRAQRHQESVAVGQAHRVAKLALASGCAEWPNAFVSAAAEILSADEFDRITVAASAKFEGRAQ